jgi:hypothetical protein
MWRSFFLALGVTTMLFGTQLLAVEKFVFRIHDDPPPKPPNQTTPAPTVGPPIELKTQPWMPYSLLATGAIVSIYSFTLSKRLGG